MTSHGPPYPRAGQALGEPLHLRLRRWLFDATSHRERSAQADDAKTNPDGRATTQRFSGAGLPSLRTVRWSYDSADRVTTLTYPSGEGVTYSYDQAWRQSSTCSSLGGCYATNAQYTALDQPTSLTFGNGLPQTWRYTSATQRLDETLVGSGEAGSALHRRYTYDLVGNLTALEDRTPATPAVQSFTYDHRDRLTSVTGPTAADNDTYRYDALGNLLEKGGQPYTYGATGNGTGAGPHQVRSKGGWNYTYDANGNLVSHNGRTYTWNSDNLPTRLTIPNGADETYTYDADGERLTRTAGGVTTVYLAGIWEEEVQSGVTRSTYTVQGRVVAQRISSPNAVVYLHADHLGSVSAVTDSTGLLVSKQDFTPWGEIRGGGSGIQETSLNFTGQRRDSTGLLYYHARYYDPNLGRFLSADSVVPGAPDGSMQGVALKALTVDFHEGGFATGIAKENNQNFWFQMSSEERQQANAPWGPANAQVLNRYAYVQNNPLGYTDPTGHYVYMEEGEAETFAATLDVVAGFILEHIDDIDLWAKGAAFIVEVIAAVLIAKGVTAPVGGVLIGAGFAIVAAAEFGGAVLSRLADSYKSLGAAVRAANGKEGVTMGMDCGAVWCDFHIKSGRGLNRNPNPTIKLRAWSGFYATWDIRWSYGHNRDYMADWKDLLDSYYLIRG